METCKRQRTVKTASGHSYAPAWGMHMIMMVIVYYVGNLQLSVENVGKCPLNDGCIAALLLLIIFYSVLLSLFIISAKCEHSEHWRRL